MNNSLEIFLHDQLQQLSSNNNLRKLVASENHGVMVRQDYTDYISFCSNDYLGIIADGSADFSGSAGAGASRLITGNNALYQQLEAEIAHAKHKPAALIFGSGYLANIGVISSLARKGDLILLDKLSHACMIDGAMLSGAKMMRFSHNNMAHLQQLLQLHRSQFNHCFVISETIFSMDGDLCPCQDLRTICDENQAWLLVDDAHGFGLPHIQAHLADIVIGTFSKAIGTYGGYVAGSEALKQYLINHARSFIFTTGLPEVILKATLHNLKQIATQPQKAQIIMDYERQITDALQLPTNNSPIIPIIIGSNEACLAAQQQLKAQGILVSAIRPPTVAINKARLRISLNAAHQPQHITQLINSLQRLMANNGHSS
jgi:8-amino-7-oxononanoate synthase